MHLCNVPSAVGRHGDAVVSTTVSQLDGARLVLGSNPARNLSRWSLLVFHGYSDFHSWKTCALGWLETLKSQNWFPSLANITDLKYPVLNWIPPCTVSVSTCPVVINICVYLWMHVGCFAFLSLFNVDSSTFSQLIIQRVCRQAVFSSVSSQWKNPT